MLLAHLSDPHLADWPRRPTSLGSFELALRRIEALQPRPDGLVITGDLTDDGSANAYTALQELTSEIGIPVHLSLGNHDDAKQALATLNTLSSASQEGKTYYCVDYPDARIVVLDSSQPEDHSGRLGTGQLAWLDETLSNRKDVPVVLAFHHPPIDVGIPVMDEIGLRDSAGLAKVLSGHQCIRLILAGHVHRVVSTSFQSVPVMLAPSTWRQVELQMLPGRQVGYVDEPTAILLHNLTPTSLVSHVVHVSHTSAPSGVLG